MNSILRLHHILSSPHDAKNLGDWDYYTKDDVPDGTRTEHVFDGESSYSKSVPVHSMGSSVFVTEETLEPMGRGDTLSAMSLVDASSIYPVFGYGGSDAIGSSFLITGGYPGDPVEAT